MCLCIALALMHVSHVVCCRDKGSSIKSQCCSSGVVQRIEVLLNEITMLFKISTMLLLCDLERGCTCCMVPYVIGHAARHCALVREEDIQTLADFAMQKFEDPRIPHVKGVLTMCNCTSGAIIPSTHLIVGVVHVNNATSLVRRALHLQK